MRWIAAILIIAAAGAAAFALGRGLAGVAEARYLARAQAALAAGGHGWARVEVDGLRLTLTGAAPTEDLRDDAASIVANLAPIIELDDRATAPERPESFAPPPRVEMLVGPDGVSVLGALPGAAESRRLSEALSRAGRAPTLFLREDAAPLGPEWAEMGALADAALHLHRGRVAAGGGAAAIIGAADAEAQEKIETAAERLRGAGWRVAVTLDIPPAPVAAFRLSAARRGGQISEIACAASTEADAVALIERFAAMGAEEVACAVGVGSPDDGWATAAKAALSALDALPAGSVAAEGRRVVLTGERPTEGAALAMAAETLRVALPAGWRMALVDETGVPAAISAPRPFALSFAKGAGLTISAPEGLDVDALTVFARALFPQTKIEVARAPAADQPAPGWGLRAQVTLSALSRVEEGEAVLNDDGVRLIGRVTHPSAAGAAQAALEGLAATSSITVDQRALAAAQPLTADRCAEAVRERMTEAAFVFEPASPDLTESGEAAAAAIAATLARCAAGRFEIGGHTDSQGSEASNLSLSRARAERVLSALLAAGAPPGRLVAKGYGESAPIAPNDTEAGRARNRRIELKPIETPE